MTEQFAYYIAQISWKQYASIFPTALDENKINLDDATYTALYYMLEAFKQCETFPDMLSSWVDFRKKKLNKINGVHVI